MNDSVASLDQHNREIQENREFWRRKPVLQKVYAEFYSEIARRVDRKAPGLIVELGSGMGNIKEHIPECITTDVFPNPWLDQVENAYALSFADQSVGTLILFDVWHHLEYPGAALKEFTRVLRPNGRVIVFEPAMGLLGKFVFGRFHHEPLGLGDEITWDAPPEFTAAAAAYYAAQGNASRVFGRREFEEKLQGWRQREVRYFSGLAYLGSGGFRGPQLYPGALLPVLSGIDALLSRLPALASRMLVVLEKAD
jgi:SAM-dependent methyltransferase